MADVALRLLGRNLIDTATLTASSAVATMPVDRLQEEDIQDLWRAASSTANVVADFGSSVELGVAMLVNANTRLTDAARVRVSSVDATGAAGDVYDSGDFAAAVDVTYAQFVHFIEPAVSGRYLRIDLSQGQTVEAGRMVAGEVWTPSHHFSFGWEPVWRDWTVRTFSLGLNLFSDERPKQRGFRFRLHGLTQTEAEDEVEMLNRLNGISRDIMVCRDKDNSNLGKTTIWGVMEGMIDYPQTNPDFFDARFEVWERM